MGEQVRAEVRAVCVRERGYSVCAWAPSEGLRVGEACGRASAYVAVGVGVRPQLPSHGRDWIADESVHERCHHRVDPVMLDTSAAASYATLAPRRLGGAPTRSCLCRSWLSLDILLRTRLWSDMSPRLSELAGE